MTKFGNLLGFKPPAAADSTPIQDTIQDLNRTPIHTSISAPRRPPITAIADKPAADKPAADKSPADKPASERNVIELDQELFFPIVAQLGEDNETVRNLLIDAEHKISELDTIKHSINKLIEPVSKALRAFEETKSQKIGLQTQFTNLRTAYNKQYDELASVEEHAASLESECTQLRELIAVAQQRIATLEGSHAEHSAELAARRTQVVDLQRIVQQLTSDLQMSRDDRDRLAERLATAEKRTVQLDADAHAARQKLQLAEKEKTAISGLLETAHANAAGLSHKLNDSDKTLSETKQRLAQVETALGEREAERARLASALAEATEKLQSEGIEQRARYEALQARSTLSETLLEESRKALASRADEMSQFERRIVQATMARNAAETRIVEVERALIDRDARIKELEQTAGRLTEHNDALTKAVDAREAAYKSTHSKLRAQDELVKLLEHQLRAARQSTELQLEELNAQLQRERLERSMAEGALEAGRRDIARLLRELAAVQYRLPASFANAAAAEPADKSVQSAA